MNARVCAPTHCRSATSRLASAARLWGLFLLGLFLMTFASGGMPAYGQTDSTWITDGDGLWTNAANWDNGEPGGGGDPNFNAFIDDGDAAVVVTLDASRVIQNLTIGDDDALAIEGLYRLTLSGGSLANDGTLTINSNGSNADTSLLASGTNLTLSGTGEIVLNNNIGGTVSQRASIDSAAGVSITQLAGHTISGRGRITADFINNGLVIANVAGGELHLVTNDKTNNASMLATGGGSLVINSIVLTNGGGTLTAEEDSRVILRNNARIAGGVLETSGTGQFLLDSGSAFLQGVTSNATINITGGHNLQIEDSLTNSGTIALNSNGANIDALINAVNSLTIDGTGEIVLNNQTGPTAPQRASLNAAAGAVLTQGANHTIRGNGRITAEFINNGLVSADDDYLQLIEGNKTNNNLFQATGGGTLGLIGVEVANTNGQILAADASTVLLRTNARVVGGTLETSGSGQFLVDFGTAFLQGVTSNGTLNVTGGDNLQLESGLTNNGTITLNSDGINSDAFINAVNSLTIGGTGEIVLNNQTGPTVSQRASLNAAAGAVLTQGANHTIRGNGQITAALINNGLVSADDVYLQLTNGSKTNNNLFQATAGGNLGIVGVDVANSNGQILAGDASTVLLRSNARVVGGVLETSGSGQFLVDTGSAFLQGVTSQATINITGGDNLQLEDGFTNNGTITVNSDGINSDAFINAVNSLAIDGTGEIVLNNTVSGFPQRASIRATSGEVLTQGADHTIRGNGQITAEFTNNGLVSADDDYLQLSNGNKTNNNLFQATAGGTLGIVGVDVANTSGQILAADASTVLLRNNTRVVGGVLETSGSGQFLVDNGSAFLQGVTSQATINITGGDNLQLEDGFTNNGSITVNSDGINADALINAVNSLTIEGTGEIVLNNTIGGFPQRSRIDAAVGQTLTQAAAHTIRGQGQISATLVNGGLVSAEGGLLRLRDGDKTNQGTFQALDGASLVMFNGVLTNLNAGTLTGGTYRSVDSGNGSLVSILGSALTTIDTDTTVALEGAGAVMTFAGVDVEDSLTTNNGTLIIADGHAFNMTSALTNAGQVSLGGTGQAAATLTSGGDIVNSPTGLISGHGTINNTILNSGTVTARDGTLAIVGGVIDGQSGTIQSEAGATLDLSAASGDSDADFLVNDGNLNLGANNVLVGLDYTNANFGTGNSFDHRANVAGTGQILADPAVAQSLGGDATDGAAATATLDFGNTRVGSPVSRSYTVDNSGSSGPALRGAIQTDNAAGNGGNLTDARLSGAGVTASNFGPVAAGASSGVLGVTFNAASAGALSGQQVAIVNNFDNVANQVLQLNGAAYNAAQPDISPTTVDFGNLHEGDFVAQLLAIANNAPAGDFSEDLRVNNFGTTGDASVNAPGMIDLVAGASDSSSVSVGLDTTTAGNKSGTVTMDQLSTGMVGGVAIDGLDPLSLGQRTINVTGNVYRLAGPSVPASIDLGEFHAGGIAQGVIGVENTGAADGFTEVLRALATGTVTGDVLSATGSADIAGGSGSGGAITAQLDISTAGERSGTAEISLTSLAGGAGLSDTALGNNTATISAKVFNLASPAAVAPNPVDFGIVHVGDAVVQTLSVENVAPAGAYTESLDATVGSSSGGASGTGSVDNLAAGAGAASGISVSVDTTTAGNRAGTVQIDFASDPNGINALGQTSLGSQTVDVVAQVNNYAVADLLKVSGDASLTQTGANEYLLNFGNLIAGGASPTAALGVVNDAAAPADDLAGQFATSGTAYAFSGFDPFSDVAAGQTLQGLTVSLDTSTPGTFGGQIIFDPRSENASGFSGALPQLVVNVTGSVGVVPEPATWVLFGIGAVIWGLKPHRRGGRPSRQR